MKIIHMKEGRIKKELHMTEPMKNCVKDKERLLAMLDRLVKVIRGDLKG
jgi:hypothetical protein